MALPKLEVRSLRTGDCVHRGHGRKTTREYLADPCDFNTSDPYEILRLPRFATSKDVKANYRKATLICHPDRVGKSRKAIAEKGFRQIQDAHDILLDTDTRRVFDNCDVEGVELFRNGFDKNQACVAVGVKKTCGELGLELLRQGVDASKAFQIVNVYQTCGKIGIDMMQFGLTWRQACPWAKVYRGCGKEGLGLVEHGVAPEDACAKLRDLKATRSARNHHYDPFAHVHHYHDPLAHLHNMQFGLF